MNRYRGHDVAVRGGHLRVGDWTTARPQGRTVLAVHGITASHLAWSWLAQAVPDVRLVAPDLRGRGRSNELPAPFGVATHVDDLIAVLESLDLGPVVLVGHSMGGFVVTMLAARRPDLVTGLLLVDGGLPLALPAGTDAVHRSEIVAQLLGPAAERLERTFPDRAAYHRFWAHHPAFAGDPSRHLERYVDYDLVGAEPHLRPATAPAALQTDSAQLYGEPDHLAALAALPGRTTFLHAPRGLLDKTPGLYPQADVAQWVGRFPALTAHRIDDVNHYTIAMSDRGAAVVGGRLCELLDGSLSPGRRGA